jgi:hypothetical protein
MDYRAENTRLLPFRRAQAQQAEQIYTTGRLSDVAILIDSDGAVSIRCSV